MAQGHHNHQHHHVTLSVMMLGCIFVSLTWSLPFSPNVRQVCPIHKELNEFNTTVKSGDNNNSRFIDLGKTDGRKIRVHFYTPNPARAIEKQLEDTTLAFPYFVDDTTGAIVPLVPIRVPDLGSTTTDYGIDTTTNVDTNTDSRTMTTWSSVPVATKQDDVDIFCQWEFQAANDSEYLLLTFNNLSAPYSTDCSEAYVSMQKDNGYESRWCGNRRQMKHLYPYVDYNGVVYYNWRYTRSPNTNRNDANARPMSLFSKSTAKITVFKKATAPVYPPTGFSVTVESLDIFAISGVENSLRVLLG